MKKNNKKSAVAVVVGNVVAVDNSAVVLTPVRRIATALHKLLAGSGEYVEDGWYYETDWNGSNHKAWEAKAVAYIAQVREATTTPDAGMFDRGLDLTAVAVSLETAAQLR